MNFASTQRAVSILAGLLGGAVVVLPITAYVLFSARFEAGSVAAEAEYAAHGVGHVVAANPELWRFEQLRLAEALAQRPGDGDRRRVLDVDGKVVAEVGDTPREPVLVRTSPVHDAGLDVARVEVTRSVRPLALRALLLCLLLAPLALGAFLYIRSSTLRVIQEGQSALRASEAWFRAITERATDMTMVFDAEKRVVYWSRGAEETLGWAASEVVGRTLSEIELIHPEDVPLLAGAQRAAERPGVRQSHLVTIRHRHKDGTWRLIEGSGRNLLDDPAVRGVVVNARDVTEQRRLEEQSRQGRKLESIGRLAGGVAHDFNNLLTVILGGAVSIREAQAEGRPVEPEDAEQIQEAAERARDLTGQLLAFARRQVITPAPVDLGAIVRGSERLLRRVVGEDVAIEVRTPDGLWPVLCDAGQMEQLLLNLAANARDAMPRGGRLTIETRNVQAEASAEDGSPGQWVVLSVRDSGAGMSPEVRDRVFEPFFTTKELGKGTGLGLATVHGIVTQNGGRILVESEPGLGTTFEVRFPRTRVTGRPAPVRATPRPPAPRGNETVLVVEDDPGVRAVTVRALRAAGHTVVAAADGPEALALADQMETLHAVVSDMVMPGMSGTDVVAALRRRRPDLRVLFVSGYPREIAARQGILEPGVDLLVKPFTPAALVARLRTVLDAA